MSLLKKVMKNLATVRDVNGNLIELQLESAAVIMPDGTTSLPDKLAADTAAQTAALDTAINALKTGDIKTLSDSLASTHTLIDEFLNGASTDNGVFDRVVELVTAIGANKDSIDGLLTDKINVSDIVNDLTTGGAAKVLSAEQGKNLKTIIDTLQASVDQQLAAIHTHGNKAVLDTVTANHTLLASKVVTALPEAWPSDVRTDGVLYLVNA